ncbi:nuclear transport factor 2 family protein [Moritella sp. 28]|uniref:nuclear transport factor 2 family protein n=1 Tax=Moritella sp. 28 TaxID=2746232 RepID=UPI001BAD6F4F|nr:nuclear transport factor 2 family protein [Moritella sp. 28]QUM84845.1 nuclear transport factor 2 family protein [Moritella sp. 28]
MIKKIGIICLVSALSFPAVAANQCNIIKSTVYDTFTAIDAARIDLETYQAVITDDSTFKFANWPASKGREAIRKAQKDFFSSVKGMSHKLQRIWIDECNVAAEGVVTYTTKDNRQVSIPFVDTFIYDSDNKVRAVNIYIDISPLESQSSAAP